MTNEKVAEQWMKGNHGKSLHMATDGLSLFSYEMKIGQTLVNGEKQGLNVQSPYFYSQTTSKHVGLVRCYADKMVNPVSIDKKGFVMSYPWYVFP